MGSSLIIIQCWVDNLCIKVNSLDLKKKKKQLYWQLLVWSEESSEYEYSGLELVVSFDILRYWREFMIWIEKKGEDRLSSVKKVMWISS